MRSEKGAKTIRTRTQWTERDESGGGDGGGGAGGQCSSKR